MLGVQQGCHDRIETYGLALLCRSCHKKMRSIRKVEDLYALLDGVADGDREFSLAAGKRLVVENGPHRDDGRTVIGDLDTYRVGQGHHTHSLGMQVHADVFLQFLDFGNLHSRSRIDLVQGHGRAYHGHDILHSDFICLQG